MHHTISKLYNKLYDLEDLEAEWYVIFYTNDNENYSFPVKSLPKNFYEFILPNGSIKMENIDKLFDMRNYDLEGKKLIEATIVENIIPCLNRHFHKSKNLNKVLNEHRAYLRKEIQKLEAQYQTWMEWIGECSKDSRLICRDCNIHLYNSKQHFETSQVQFVICEKCSHIPQGIFCQTDGCSNYVNRNMVTGEPYPKCFNCYNIFERKKTKNTSPSSPKE